MQCTMKCFNIYNQIKSNKMKNQKTTIEVNICFYVDEVTGKKVYDFEEMADEFEQKLSELDESVVVMVSIQ